MSRIIETTVGRFREVTDGSKKWFLWECRCGTWCSLSDAQWSGSVSVNHDSQGCPSHYHETHEYGKVLLNTIQAANSCPYIEDAEGTRDE